MNESDTEIVTAVLEGAGLPHVRARREAQAEREDREHLRGTRRTPAARRQRLHAAALDTQTHGPAA